MPGKKSRDKGGYREREAAKLLGAEKVSRMYQPGPDLLWRGRGVEVKARADGFKELHKWLKDAQLLMLKSDRKPWLIVIPYDEFRDLLEEHLNEAQGISEQGA